MYESLMNEELLGKLPVDSLTLNDLHKQKKLYVLEQFRLSYFAEGIAGDTFVRRLQDNIRQIKTELEEDNLYA